MNDVDAAAEMMKGISNDGTMSEDERIAVLRNIMEGALLRGDIRVFAQAFSKAAQEGGNRKIFDVLAAELLKIFMKHNAAEG